MNSLSPSNLVASLLNGHLLATPKVLTKEITVSYAKADILRLGVSTHSGGFSLDDDSPIIHIAGGSNPTVYFPSSPEKGMVFIIVNNAGAADSVHRGLPCERRALVGRAAGAGSGIRRRLLQGDPRRVHGRGRRPHGHAVHDYRRCRGLRADTDCRRMTALVPARQSFRGCPIKLSGHGGKASGGLRQRLCRKAHGRKRNL